MASDSEAQLRKAVIRLAHENPDGIREHLVPIIRGVLPPPAAKGKQASKVEELSRYLRKNRPGTRDFDHIHSFPVKILAQVAKRLDVYTTGGKWYLADALMTR